VAEISALLRRSFIFVTLTLRAKALKGEALSEAKGKGLDSSPSFGKVQNDR